MARAIQTDRFEFERASVGSRRDARRGAWTKPDADRSPDRSFRSSDFAGKMGGIRFAART